MSHFAHQVGFDAGAIAAEIRALNPKAFSYQGQLLYNMEVCDRAIRNVSADAMQKMRQVATQPIKTAPKAQASDTKAGTAAKKATARKPAEKKTVAAT